MSVLREHVPGRDAEGHSSWCIGAGGEWPRLGCRDKDMPPPRPDLVEGRQGFAVLSRLGGRHGPSQGRPRPGCIRLLPAPVCTGCCSVELLQAILKTVTRFRSG